MFERFLKKLGAGGAAGLELGAIRSQDAAEVELRHPVGDDPLGAFVTLASPDAPVVRQARLDIARAQRQLGDLDAEQSAEVIDEQAAEFLSRVVLGWRGIKEDGADLPFSQAEARRLFAKPELRWLVNQLLREAARQENFIETSAPA